MHRHTLPLICVLTVGCGGSLAPAEAPAEVVPPEGGADYIIDSAVVEHAVLRINGSGNLPDGALISYEVKHEGFDVGDYDGYETGQIEFNGGTFTFEMSVADWPTGHALIKLVFEMQPTGDMQPAVIIEAYGENGERLTGPNVEDFGGRKTIAVFAEAEIS